MGSNSFGKLFKITTWGESHGKALGLVIDGCPANLEISTEEVQNALKKRSPGTSPVTSPRKEPDHIEIISGLFEGKTTGTPISMIIHNQDADSSKYEPIKDLLRPGHANYTYQEKYGIFDYRGGGRASARETVCRVAAGAIAKKLLSHLNIEISAFLYQVGAVCSPSNQYTPSDVEEKMYQEILQAKEAGDSIGGIVSFIAKNVPVGYGEPVYEKIEANLAKAMLSIPASKGFEIGSGFSSVTKKGSEHNDEFYNDNNQVKTRTNHSGGTLGGITNGELLYGKVAFKPTSSILLKQKTLNTQKQESIFQIPPGSKHDPCVAVRAVPVVEAMLALVLADAALLNRKSKL